MSRPSSSSISPFFFSTHTPTTELYTLSLHDALPLSAMDRHPATEPDRVKEWRRVILGCGERHRDAALPVAFRRHSVGDRKSTRLNSSHTVISYAVFCLKKKKKKNKYKLKHTLYHDLQ